MEKKVFKFKKGTEDWKTWGKTIDFILEFFTRKRKRRYVVCKLKTDYKITVIIEKNTPKR